MRARVCAVRARDVCCAVCCNTTVVSTLLPLSLSCVHCPLLADWHSARVCMRFVLALIRVVRSAREKVSKEKLRVAKRLLRQAKMQAEDRKILLFEEEERSRALQHFKVAHKMQKEAAVKQERKARVGY
jgi:hypothetical protein